MNDQPIVIVGGGLAGVSTLYALVSRGLPARLLEAGDDLAVGASFANGGMLTSSMPDPWNGPGVGKHLVSSLFDSGAAMKLHWHMIPNLVFWGLKFLRNSTPKRHEEAIAANYALSALSVEKTAELVEDLDMISFASPSGVIKVFEDEVAHTVQSRNAALLEDQGLRFEELSRERLIALEPNLARVADRFVGAIHFPDDRSGDAHAFCQALAQRAQQLGAEIALNTPVKRLVKKQGRVIGVETRNGIMTAQNVVLCAGQHSPDLMKSVSLSLPIKPAKGYSVTFDVSQWNDRPRIPVVDDAMHAAVTPMGDQLRVVGTAEFAGRDPAISKPRIDNLRAMFTRLYPDLADKAQNASSKAWAGFRPMSADGRPFIGESAVPGLWLNTGHGHLGWTMATGSAELLASLMIGERPALNPLPYSPIGR
ncbi:MAG: FAD-dependent oxidoreductase [Pseudomonadota bacterium]